MSRRPGSPDRDGATPPRDEATAPLRTLRLTVPMRRPAPPVVADPEREAPICRTTLLRLPPGGPVSPCHPDALPAASARPATRQRVALALVLLLALVLVPMAVRAVWGLFRASAPSRAPTSRPLLRTDLVDPRGD